MTYQILREEIEDLIAVSDVQGIINLITPINVALVVATQQLPVGERIVPYTDLISMSDDYKALLILLGVASTVEDVLDYFTPEYALTAQFGREYEETREYTEIAAMQESFSDPESESEIRTLDYFTYLQSLQS